MPDAETVADLETIAAGLRVAWLEAPQIVVRCAPTFASVLSGAGATHDVDLPPIGRGLLVVVGSHVPMTHRSARRAERRAPRLARRARRRDPRGRRRRRGRSTTPSPRRGSLLSRDRLAVVATSRAIAAEALGPTAGMRVAQGLAAIVDRLRGASDVLLSKGGITSAVNVRDGLGAERAQIVGPGYRRRLALARSRRATAHDRPVIVFPGNVGETDTLAALVDRLLEGVVARSICGPAGGA